MQAAEKLETQENFIVEEGIKNISSLSPICRGCRNLQITNCKKGMTPKPKFGGGQKCNRYHPILKN